DYYCGEWDISLSAVFF
nr:immunoglobulin light chain junction region [Macaca mulatta]